LPAPTFLSFVDATCLYALQSPDVPTPGAFDVVRGFRARIARGGHQHAPAAAGVAAVDGAATARRQAEVLSGAGDLLGAFLRGRSRSNPLSQVASRRAATRKAKARAEAAMQRLSDKERQLEELEDDLGEEIIRITEEWAGVTEELEEVEIPLERADVRVADLKLVWLPVS
jgi:hypothetical protein